MHEPGEGESKYRNHKMGRDRGKGKRGGRGGGKKMMIANIEELQLRNMQISDGQRNKYIF